MSSPAAPNPVDPGPAIAQWRERMEAVCRLVGSVDDEALSWRVPACPDWTVRDLLSHMVGLGSDVLDGDEPDDHNPAWTTAQVEARAGRSAADLVSEWRGLAEGLAAWMREHGTRPLSDVTIHEHDLRGALGQPGDRDVDAVRIVRDAMAGRLRTALPAGASLVLAADDGSWTLGPRDAEVEVRASGFDLFRALTSRRTAQQLHGWTVRGDLTPYVGSFALLGPLPENPLVE